MKSDKSLNQRQRQYDEGESRRDDGHESWRIGDQLEMKKWEDFVVSAMISGFQYF